MSKRDIARVARQILSGDIDPIEGCRRIVSNQGALTDIERNGPDLMVLVAIESETDHFPLGTSRHHWNPEALAEQDRLRREYLVRNENVLRQACKAIIDTFAD